MRRPRRSALRPSVARRVRSRARGTLNAAAPNMIGATSTTESGRHRIDIAIPAPKSSGPPRSAARHTSTPSTATSTPSPTPGSENPSVDCHNAGVSAPAARAVIAQTAVCHPRRRPMSTSTAPLTASSTGFASVTIAELVGATHRCTTTNGSSNSVVPKPYEGYGDCVCKASNAGSTVNVCFVTIRFAR